MPFTIVSVLPLLLVAAVLSGCDRKSAQAPPRPTPKVATAHPELKRTQEWDEFTGRFAAPESVSVQARVSGYLTEIHFRDGQIVKQGDLLFVIDPRPYAAAVAAAEADVASAEATLHQARLDFSRAEQLTRDQFTPRQTYDQRAADVRRGEARVGQAQAQLAQAKLNLEFTVIRSPITGRVDRHNVSVGNLVSGSASDATLLTTINSLDPMYLYFDVDQNTYLRYTRANLAGTRPTSRDNPNPVRLALPDEKGFPHLGRMDFVSNTLDLGTGTLRGRAVFDNADGLFSPGQFARVQLIGSGEYDAVMIPDEAVGTDQTSRFVYVVADGRAEARPVELGPIIDGKRVVRSGLAAGDTIIVSGLYRVRRGQPVEAEPLRPPSGA